MTGIGPITSIASGHAANFEGVYIRKYWTDQLLKRFGSLVRVTFHLHLEASTKLRFLFFSDLAYMDWAEKWINSLGGGSDFGGFDFGAMSKRRSQKLLDDIYETVQEIRSGLQEESNS